MKDTGDIAAILDLDLTLTNRDSFKTFLAWQYLYIKKNWNYAPIVFFWGCMRKTRLITLQMFKEKALASIKGVHRDNINKTGEYFFQNHMIKSIRPVAMKKIEWHRKHKHKIFLATASPDIYVHAVAKYVESDDYICSQLQYRNGIFSGKFEGKDCIGPEKAEQVKTILNRYNINTKISHAYSDNESDLPLFELIGNPVAVSPTKKLKSIALDRNWKVEIW